MVRVRAAVLASVVLIGCKDAQHARVEPATVEPALGEASLGEPTPEIVSEPAPEPVPIPTRADALELTFVGDVVLGRYLEHHGDDVFVEMHPPSEDPFAAVEGLLRADVVVGNLESPIVRELPLRPPIDRTPRFAGSAAHLGQLERAGFDVLSLANNHFFDLGVPGQLDGPQALSEAGMFAIGASRQEGPPLRVETLEVDGWRIGFLAFATVRNHRGAPDGPQLPFTSLADLDELDGELAHARGQHDLLIAVVHWGAEYEAQVGLSNRLAARRLLDAGIDLVVGHHPHVLQALELRGGGLIAYSLGNFLFPRNDGGTELSGVLRVRYAAGDGRACLEAARLHPVHMVRKPRWHPEPASGSTAERVRARLIELSRGHKTRLRAGEGEDLILDGVRGCE